MTEEEMAELQAKQAAMFDKMNDEEDQKEEEQPEDESPQAQQSDILELTIQQFAAIHY